MLKKSPLHFVEMEKNPQSYLISTVSFKIKLPKCLVSIDNKVKNILKLYVLQFSCLSYFTCTCIGRFAVHMLCTARTVNNVVVLHLPPTAYMPYLAAETCVKKLDH